MNSIVCGVELTMLTKKIENLVLSAQSILYKVITECIIKS